jgi:diguanylate cyclase (GGDEF)-like protein
MSKPLILCVAQDDALNGDVKRALNGSVFRLQFYQTPAGALSVVADQPVSAFLVDFSLVPDPGTLIAVLREAAPTAAMLALCSPDTVGRAVEAQGVGEIGGLLLQPLPADAALHAVYRGVATAILDRLSHLLPDAADRLLRCPERSAVMSILRELLVEAELAPCAAVSPDLRVSASPWQKELFKDDDLRLRLDALVTLLLRLAGSVVERLASGGEEVSEYDTLTGVFNRHGLKKALAREIERCERYSSALAVLVIDLDGFAAINDHHGRQARDRILKGLGNVLDGLTRRTDVIARLENDEFCLLLPGLGNAEAVQAAKRFQREVATWSNAAMHGVPISLSCGVAVYGMGDKDAELTVGTSLAALEFARTQGLASIAYYEGEPRLAPA